MRSSIWCFQIFTLMLGVVRPAYADEVDDYLQASLTERRIPGIAVAVLQKGALLKMATAGLSNLETETTVTTQTAFDLASMTKPFTATAVMLLEKDGELGLDDRAMKFVPDLPSTWTEITVRHLLTHTSGLPELFPEEESWPGLTDYSTSDIVRSLVGLPLLFPPGTGAQYSDPGYFLLGLIVEKVSGQRFADFLASRVFEPLQMNHSGMIDLRKILKGRAATYTIREGETLNARRVWQWELAPSFGMYSTIEDLARWEAALVSGALLDRSTLLRMWTPARLASGEPVQIWGLGYGLGWMLADLDGRPTAEHGGFTGTHILRCLDDSLTVIVLTNLDRASGNQPHRIARDLARLAVGEVVR